MTHRALVERDASLADFASGVVDAYNNPLAPDWQTHIEAQPCFLRTDSGVEVVAPDRTVVVDRLSLLMPWAADVSTRDRISGITDRLGNPIIEGILNIRSALRHHDHLELQMERAS